jgi:hypothetical protein
MTVEDRQMTVKTEDDGTPEGKRWTCCIACHGTGRVLVDDVGIPSRPESVSNGSDGIRRYSSPFSSLMIVQTRNDDEGIIHSDQREPSAVLPVNVAKRRYDSIVQ